MRWIILILLLSLQADASGQQRPYRERRVVLDAEATVLVYAASRDDAQPFLDAAFTEMQRVESLLKESGLFHGEDIPYSTYVDEEVSRLLNRALGWASLSGGAYDPTAATLNQLWGADTPSPDSMVEAAQLRLGWQYVSLDILNSELRFEQPGMRLDPNTLGRGYALDAAAKVLSDSGSGPALLSIGSTTYRALDPPPGQIGWLINVNDPSDEGTLSSTVRLSHAALSTFPRRDMAGSEPGNTSFPDPRTGRPAVVSTQATVVTGDATDAAVLASMVFVLGPGPSEVVLADVPGVKAWIIHPAPDGHAVRAIRWPAPSQVP